MNEILWCLLLTELNRGKNRRWVVGWVRLHVWLNSCLWRSLCLLWLFYLSHFLNKCISLYFYTFWVITVTYCVSLQQSSSHWNLPEHSAPLVQHHIPLLHHDWSGLCSVQTSAMFVVTQPQITTHTGTRRNLAADWSNLDMLCKY